MMSWWLSVSPWSSEMFVCHHGRVQHVCTPWGLGKEKKASDPEYLFFFSASMGENWVGVVSNWTVSCLGRLTTVTKKIPDQRAIFPKKIAPKRPG